MVLAGHASLRLGDASALLQAWASKRTHALLFTGGLIEYGALILDSRT